MRQLHLVLQVAQDLRLASNGQGISLAGLIPLG
jgi:hypothetical protein